MSDHGRSDPGAERARLETISMGPGYGKGPNEAMVRYSARVFASRWRAGRCLELGPAEGIMTDVLASAFSDLTVVDGAQAFIDAVRIRHPTINAVCALFEEYSPSQIFETVLMGHVLEHVEDPVQVLRRARDWLAPGGVLIAAVPNAYSIHRQAAVEMGLLADVHAFSPADVQHGHRRVYDRAGLLEHVEAAGLQVLEVGGYWLKPVSNAQIEATWTAEMTGAFMALGERYPEIAAEIFVVAGR